MSSPKEVAARQSEQAFDLFILATKRVVGWSVFFLLLVVVGCNSGVESGKGKTGSGYNGQVYSPSNLNVKK